MRTTIIFLLIASLAYAAPEIGFDTNLLKFGYISEGGSHARALGVENNGDQDLIISLIDMPDPVFTLTAPSLPATVEPGETETFLIAFDPDATGAFNGDFIFYSNDPVNPSATLSGEAQGVPVFNPGQIIWSFQGIENVVSCTAINDINGDGFEDVVADSYDAGAPQQDHLFCISGSGFQSGDVIWSARPLGGPSNSGGYGDDCLKVTEDLNDNGTYDLIYGTSWGSRSIFGIEGSTGQTIWTYDLYANPPSGWVYSVNPIHDLNGDGINEVIAGAGSDANAGYCLDGSDGTLLWKKQAADVIYATAALDDINDDGIPDAVFGAGDNDDNIYCISGASSGSPQQIWTYDTQGASVQSMDRIADIDGDGFNDVIVGTWYNNNRIIALSGHSVTSADTIWTATVGNRVMKVVACDDLNGDSYQDVLVASWGNYADALSGADGSSLWRYFCGGQVWAIYWAHDITGDGIVDVAAGSFTGSVFLINGATGQLIWESPSDAKIFTVRPIKDVNGDGFDDVIAGQQMLGSVGGKFFVISGGTVIPTGVDDGSEIVPQKFELLANYPNPFNSQTVISFNLPAPAEARIDIYDIAGRQVRNINNDYGQSGRHTVIWDGTDNYGNQVSTGIYFYRLTAGEMSQTRKMTLLK